MHITSTYDPADDKIRISASQRLDADTYAKVKAAGYGWAPKQGVFYAVWSPKREDIALELAGEIDDEDTTLVDRAEQRAERFEGYQENRTADAHRAKAAVHSIADGIPFGQPILVGHHSEKHARRDAEKIENGMRRAIKMWDTAQYWQSRAAGALAHAKYKEMPAVRARRIKTIEAEVRSMVADYTPHKDTPAIMQTPWDWSPSCGYSGPQEQIDAERKAASVPHVWVGPKGRGGRWTRADGLERMKAGHARSIAHCEMRLLYERAMLEEAGASSLLEKKKRPALLPLCNYRAPEGLNIENRWNRGQMIHYAQVEMTQAEYAKIYTDYKGTHIIGNSHRVRTAVIRHDHVCVFLTDSKVHAIPQAVEHVPVERPMPTPTYSYTVPERTEFDDLKDALKAGVQVVSVPQLFPTPKELAARMVQLAGIVSSGRVLEPSAGTGVILQAIGDVPERVAVEINHNLAAALRRSGRVEVIEGDFLEQNGNLGKFDAVLMNPPFINGSDIKHIQHARKFLKPGGVLVAICANGPRQREALMDLAEHWEDLQAGTFANAGANVNTALLVIRGGAA